MKIAWRRVLAQHDDDELLRHARGGDHEAYGELYARYEASARRYARSFLHSSADADDAVANVFTRIINAVRAGGGPRDSFAAYLFTSLRHECSTISRRNHREATASRHPPAVEDPVDLSARVAEAAVMRNAYASLPRETRQLLELTEIRQLRPSEVAARVGAASDVTAVRTMRARRALGAAYLSQHLPPPPTPADPGSLCRTVRAGLVRYVRGTGRAHQRRHIEEHLAGCPDCRDAHAELDRVNAQLRTPTWPLLLLWLRSLVESTPAAVSGLLSAVPASAATILTAATITAAVPAATSSSHDTDRPLAERHITVVDPILVADVPDEAPAALAPTGHDNASQPAPRMTGDPAEPVFGDVRNPNTAPPTSGTDVNLEVPTVIGARRPAGRAEPLTPAATAPRLAAGQASTMTRGENASGDENLSGDDETLRPPDREHGVSSTSTAGRDDAPVDDGSASQNYTSASQGADTADRGGTPERVSWVDANDQGEVAGSGDQGAGGQDAGRASPSSTCASAPSPTGSPCA